MSRIKLYTHRDMDGYGCYIAFILKAKEVGFEVDVEFVNYDTLNEKVKKHIETGMYKNYSTTYITDISVNKEVADMMYAIHSREITDPNFGAFYIIDHHSTAIFLDEYETMAYINADGVESGTSMVADYLWEGQVPQEYREFFNHIREYDTWIWKRTGNDQAGDLNMLFGILGGIKFSEYFINKLENRKPIFNNNDKILLVAKKNEIESYCRKKFNQRIIKNIDSAVAKRVGIEADKSASFGNVAIVYADNFINDVAEYVYLNDLSVSFVTVVDVGGKTVSLRCPERTDIHMGNLAKIYGGGGHPKAAGYPLGDDKFNKITNRSF